MRPITPILMLAALTTACDPSDPSVDPGEPRISDPSPELSATVAQNNDFAFKLYREIAQTDGDVFFSPFSAAAALRMTLAGARGDTMTQMMDTLSIDGDEQGHDEFGALVQDLSGDKGRPYQLAIANRLFGQVSYPWMPEFLDVTEAAYAAPLEEVDYVGDTEGARQIINSWVSDQTQGLIDELLNPGILTANTRLVLANAIYFKADWDTQFDPEDTRPWTFQLADGSSTEVDMMTRENAEVRIATDADVQVLELEYATGDLSMLVVLPHEVDGLADVEASLDVARFEGWLADLQPVDLDMLALPRFEIDSEIPLKPVLQTLGMTDAFQLGAADFSGIADISQTGEPLYVQDVVQKAYVSVDEAGTEAAAATAVVVGTESVGPMFLADRPFAFAIRDNVSGSILFLGRVSDPGA